MQSTDLITPLAIGTPIATTGDKNIPPENASGADTSSITAGFLPITSEPLDDGGIAPERTDFNGMFYLATDQRVFLQNGGVITYEDTVATKIGGYPQNAILGYIDNSGNLGFVKSLVNNNQYNFVTNPSYIDGVNWEYVNLSNFSLLNPTFTDINDQLAKCVKTEGTQSVGGTKTFTSVCYGTKSANNNSLLTTVSKTGLGTQSGYIELGNGIIINWLKFSQTTNSQSHTWKKKFSSATSYVTMVSQIKGGSSAQNIAVQEQTQSTFKVYAENVERAQGLYALAIGT